MSIEQIQALSLNPRFISKLIQGFLTGYDKPCDIRLIFIAMPVLLSKRSREKLLTANISSRIDTIFSSNVSLSNSEFLSGESRLAGFLERYNNLLPYCKQALVVTCSEQNAILLPNHSVISKNKLEYKKQTGTIRNWIRAANYLGIIFAKSSAEQLSYILEVDIV